MQGQTYELDGLKGSRLSSIHTYCTVIRRDIGTPQVTGISYTDTTTWYFVFMQSLDPLQDL